ncbi:ankyrin repeat protein [Annulohypoxylon maeteangense]|uniref:ankyrin repeat protein n=1 Tax=Annulohypoxylon maeteangense TaxID=1927788 RepID=UPI0020078883|nr:ankyrin repeat protein [Annulohypoxylon maeteangense]KAI0883149.1 ankyrin repeat protein [Annulohypoxylon maeteangense]
MGSKSHGDYTVGWISALPKEQTAAMAMLDQIHPDLENPPNDHNAYTLGSIGEHNIVVACLPKGKIGTNSAAIVATRMVDTFPSIKFGLMVGIGGGIPPKVRLGDVVVSSPVDEYPGVVQWDLGKAEKDGKFKRTGALNNPPSALLAALTKLESNHEISESKIPQYLNEVEKKWPKLAPRYTSFNSLKDPLLVPRHCEDQNPRDVRVHYGLVASGNQVIKDGELRDSLNNSFGGNILCVEMEAAGLINDFPCIVIRGICDYADSRKNKDWQEYAAMIAAGYAKELLGYVRPVDIHAERPVRDLLHKVAINIENIESKLEKKEDLNILEWLSSTDYTPQQSDFINRRQPGTGQWLLDSAKYKKWLGVRGQTLFCTGIPGAGKTILCSLVIDNLMAMASVDSTISVAYIYFNFKREDQQRINDLLRSLMKQLLRKLSSLPDFIKVLHEEVTKDGIPLPLDGISENLQLVIALYSHVYIVIDALDECQTSDGCRSKLISQISKLQNSIGANFFVTSRHIPDIEQHFRESITQEIRASNDDVRKYLDGHMPNLDEVVGDDAELREDIKDQIVEATEGMFLLAHLYFESLNGKTSKREIKDVLKDFKKRGNREFKTDDRRTLLDAAYDDAMERVNSQREERKRLGRKVLGWITCAKRPLSVLELQHGLAVKIGDTKLDEDNIRNIEMIRSVCSGLVIVDEESGIIRLVHYTTQEYFDTRQQSLFQEQEAGLMMACVTYLSFTIFESEFCNQLWIPKRRLTQTPFYEYAARNWGYHARDITMREEEEELILGFLMNDAKASSASQVMMTKKEKLFPGYDSDYDSGDDFVLKIPPDHGSGIHIAAWFGLGDIMIECPFRNSTALTFAVENGHETIDPNLGEEPALHLAVMRHYTAIVSALLTHDKVEPNRKDGKGETPLSIATKTIVLDAKNSNGDTALIIATLHKEEVMARMLLDRGAGPDLMDKFDRSPLFFLSKDEPNRLFERLDYYGSTPLSIAVRFGHEKSVTLFLDTGKVDVNSRDNFGRTPLWWATKRGYSHISKLLMSRCSAAAKIAQD